MPENKLLSIILLSYYSKQRIINVYNKVNELLTRENIPFELIVMDDGSKDESYATALKLEQNTTNVFAYQLSRNYTSHYSIFAGLSVCKGQCAMAIPDDEQQPYFLIVEMYRLWEKGHQVILPYRTTRNDPFFSKMFSTLYYQIMNSLSVVSFPLGGADTFFVDREIIDILNKNIHPINTSSITEVLRLGFSPHFFPYERPRGVNSKSRWTFRKKLKLAADTFFSCSTIPIKAITYLGFFFSGTAFLLALFYTYIKLFGNPVFWGNFPAGWVSLVLLIVFFGGAILLSIGVLAEYIWRIYEEVKNRPGYIIKQKK